MRKLLTLVLGVAACFGASAQYISLQQGTTLEYKSTLYQDKDSMTLNTVAKILSVTEADGVTTVLTQKTTPMENTPLGVKTDTTTTVYTAADKSTKFIMSTAEEAKQGVIDMIKMQIQASGQSVSVADMDDLVSSIRAKGELSITLNPDMAAGTKLPNKNLRVSVGQETMSYNIGEAKVEGTESVTTPAGTFDCLKVSFVNRISAGPENQKINVTEWFAPGVGVVKIQQTLKGKPVMNQELVKLDVPQN